MPCGKDNPRCCQVFSIGHSKERCDMEIKNELNPLNKKSHGQLTAEIGKTLELEGYDVFYDHGISGKTVGRIVSYFSDTNERGTQLSYLDIAIVKKDTNQAVALIEIEETANKPKTIIGDIFAFLMGEKVVFQGKELEVGNWTTLIILGFSKLHHLKHNEYILEKVENAKSALGTKNCEIRKIVIETFSDKETLSGVLTPLLQEALKGEL
jgi:hypothetical protein